MAKQEHRNFPAHPHKGGSKTVTVAPSKKQSGYKRTMPRKAK
ncbi:MULTISPECIES: hypothetical protein [Lactiplantibacillus]|nr:MULTISPECIES: hypothetical protein [Lactiplantibacillus]MCG0677971.1 hypothetical protein [Lactiplantibacillus plantarum]MCG0892474.1 hypothetical protein [Lactiplantibacillus plantarum]MCG0899735.1 hypothetical protein [Lactiplantibacillus plantarum]QHM39150.1 hypothetical protein C7M37_00125 [Lactiplantibacillus plantarum]